MSKLLSLIKTELLATFQIKHLKYYLNNKNNRATLIALIIALLSLMPMYYYSFATLESLYLILDTLNQTSFFIYFMVIIIQVIIFFLSLIMLLSRLYFSKDLDLLLSLPIKTKDIMSAKLISTLPLMYIITLTITLPFYRTYYIYNPISFSLIFYSLSLFLLLPILPSVISAIIGILFMKYTNIKKYQNIIRSVLIATALALLIYLQYQLQVKFVNVIVDPEKIVELVVNANFFLEILGKYLPFSLYGALMLTQQSISNFMLYFLITSIASISYLNLFENLYLTSYLKNQNIESFRITHKYRTQTKKQSVIFSLIKKEIIVLVKTPIYLFNLLGGIIALPILSFTMFQTLKEIVILDFIDSDSIILISIAVLTLFAIIGNSAQTTFSREGKAMWLNQTLPIKASEQIIARVLVSIIFILPTNILFLTALKIFLNINIIKILIVFLISLITSIKVSLVSLLIDATRPYLNWETPQKAMKQNINVLISTAINAASLFVIATVVYKLINYLPNYLLFIIIIIIYVLISMILYKYLLKHLTKNI